VRTHQTRAAGPSSDGLLDALVQAAYLVMAALNRIGAEHDLSLTQLRVMGILRDRRVRMAELADHLGLEKSTMTGLVDRAERRGLLQRAPNPVDGRAVDVLISPAGAHLAERVSAELAQALTAATNRLGVADRQRLQALLQTLVVNAEP
jgi:DNA-binding MarR family transcriptional regulator